MLLKIHHILRFFCMMAAQPLSAGFFADMAVPRLILLDRDGVVNQDVGAPGIICPSQLQSTPNAGIAIGRLKRSGCKIALITNQSCVGKGLINIQQLNVIHQRIQDMLFEEDEDAGIDHIFFCTSLRDSGDPRMKPNPGMISEACEMFSVDVSECLMIGDALRDLQAAAAAGVTTRILVETGYGKSIMQGRSAPNEDFAQIKSRLEYNAGDCAETDIPKELPFLYARNLDASVNYLLKS